MKELLINPYFYVPFCISFSFGGIILLARYIATLPGDDSARGRSRVTGLRY